MSVERPLFVLNGFAMLAYFNGEAGMPRVQAVLRDARENRCRAVMPLINLGEVLYITEREVGCRRRKPCWRRWSTNRL